MTGGAQASDARLGPTSPTGGTPQDVRCVAVRPRGSLFPDLCLASPSCLGQVELWGDQSNVVVLRRVLLGIVESCASLYVRREQSPVSLRPPSPPAGHEHPLPVPDAVQAALAHAPEAAPGVAVDVESVERLLAAVGVGCRGCRTLMVRWLAEDGDPWTVVCLGGRVVHDARRVWSAAHGPDSRPSRALLQAILRDAFGPAVATVLGPLAAGEATMAVDIFRMLPPLGRCEGVEHIAEAIAQPPEPVALGVLAGLRVVREDPRG